MKLFLSLVMMLTTLIGQDLTSYQRDRVLTCKKAGEPYDLGNTLAGICYHESLAGLIKVNPNSGDYGITQININSLLDRLHKRHTAYNISYYATILVEDDEYAMRAALAELYYWKLDRKRTGWHHMLNSYNEGNSIERGTYSLKIAKAIKYLKQQGVL